MTHIKRFLKENKKKTVVLCVGSAVALSSTSAFATAPPLTAAEQALVDAVTGKLDALVGAVSSLVTANLGVVAAIVIGSLIIGYFWRAGRG